MYSSDSQCSINKLVYHAVGDTECLRLSKTGSIPTLKRVLIDNIPGVKINNELFQLGKFLSFQRKIIRRVLLFLSVPRRRKQYSPEILASEELNKNINK